MNRYLYLVLMAAGNSRRFGSNKLLHEIDGRPMYRAIFNILADYQKAHPDSCRFLVVSQYDEILAAVHAENLMAIRNTRPDDGIAWTIHLAVEAAAGQVQPPSNQQGEGLVFFTADQPYLRAETVTSFLDRARTVETGLLVARADGQSGNPVFFDQAYYPELLALTGDTGGKRVVNAHPDDVTWFTMAAKELTDIDEP